MNIQTLKSSMLAAVLVVAGGITAAQAQVDNTTCLSVTTSTWCVNQTIARDPTNPYQMNPNNKVHKVLLYDKAKAHPDGKAAYRRALIRTAYRYGFELVITDAAIGYITASTLAGTDLVIFTQGDEDVVAPQNSASENALADYIYRQGKSMLMIHASAAFITCPGTGSGGGGANITDPTCHFMARAVARQYLDHVAAGTKLRIYADSTQAGQIPPYPTGVTAPGIAVISHGRVNDETKNIFNNTVPFNWVLPPNSPTDPRTYVWDAWADEHYAYYNNPGPRYIPASTRDFNGVTYTEGRLNILTALDEAAGAGNGNVAFAGTKMADHPESWVRHMGNGLAGYINSPHDNAPLAARTGGGRDGTIDSVFTKYNWNVIRFLAHDYAGCMNPAFQEYNPNATVTVLTASDTAGAGNSCKTPTALLSVKGTRTLQGVTAMPQGIRIATPEVGVYRVYVSDLKGHQIYAKPVMGGVSRNVEIQSLSSGSYFVHVTSPAKEVSSARVVVD